MTFNDFGLRDAIIKAVREKGYGTPTPVQAEAIPQILAGRDILGSAQTGTGKTAAFCIPILQILSSTSTTNKNPRALILAPTRELAIQVADNLKAYGKNLALRSVTIFGGVSQVNQEREIRRGADIIVATPGRLLDLINQRIVKLDQLQILVLDEADRMLDMGFIHDIKRIINVIPATRQNLFFSATMPAEVQKLVSTILKNPARIAVKSPTVKAQISQAVYFVSRESKRALLKHVISEKEMKNVIVFARTKHGADKIAKDLNKSGISAEAIHGNKSQNARQRALSNFKSNTTRVLVATDIAARGIDIADLPYVINYELPETVETYTHRIGRTGRAGQVGAALSFCDHEEKDQLNSINKASADKLLVIDHPFNAKNEIRKVF